MELNRLIIKTNWKPHCTEYIMDCFHYLLTNVTTHSLQHSVRKQNKKIWLQTDTAGVTANKITQPILNAGRTTEFISN